MTAAIESSALSSPIGLIAGNGVFPVEFAEHARAKNLDVICVAHRGETDQRIERIVSSCTWIRVGELGKIIKVLVSAKVKQAAFAGGIKKVTIFDGLRPDLQAISLVLRLGSVKDDVLLRGIASEIEGRGIEVISASVLLQKSVPKLGTLTHRDLSVAEMSDARLGFEAARGVGSLDIGQTVVTCQGVVAAVEAVEGTDLAIQRAGDLIGKKRAQSNTDGMVVVKLAKPQQDLRFDLPAVGKKTIEVMKESGATALILEAERSLILEPDEVVRAANTAGIAIRVVTSIEELK